MLVPHWYFQFNEFRTRGSEGIFDYLEYNMNHEDDISNWLHKWIGDLARAAVTK